MDVKLDKAALKALSNDTRVDILKELQRRRHTQSELAEELELSVPTIKEHLTALEKAGLVEMHDEGRKWKYYSLTKKSKAILTPESVNIFIVLGTFILSVIGGVYSYIISMPEKIVRTYAVPATEFQTLGAVEESVVAAKGVVTTAANDMYVATSSQDMVATSANDIVAASADEAVRYAVPEAAPIVTEPSFLQVYGIWIFSAIAIISAILFIYFISKRVRLRSRLGKSLNKK
jgi:DNA-binding transcriptional ArsR family regulator